MLNADFSDHPFFIAAFFLMCCSSCSRHLFKKKKKKVVKTSAHTAFKTWKWNFQVEEMEFMPQRELMLNTAHEAFKILHCLT